MTHDGYLFETFGSDQMRFDEEFTRYLNDRRTDGWKVKECSYRHESGGQTMASCLFEKEW